MSAIISRLTFEYLRNPLGVGVSRPRLSWIVETTTPNWIQSAYEIEARGMVVRAESSDSVLVDWPFAPLGSRERLTIGVRVAGPGGEWTEWIHADVEAALLRAADWSAAFVSPGQGSLVRGEFLARPGLRSARLYATALGVYEACLNGSVVGDHVLAPGWTAYHQRLRYQTFDVTGLIVEGPNCLGATVGDGWYRGRLGFEGKRAHYGDHVAFLAQLELTYQDGTVERIVTDETWMARSGPLLSSDLYDGEHHDARLEPPDWSTTSCDDAGWEPVRVIQHDLGTLFAAGSPPVRRTEILAPVATTVAPSGATILDFGQNLVGRLRVTVRGEAGEKVILRHAEVLQDGELCTAPLRTAQATDTYVLADGGPRTWEPRFTFHGFRYAEVTGPVESAVAVVCHSDLERTGWFSCSDPLVERLHDNVVWSMRGNFLDVPTDCPQRDERLGWTGDLQVFAPTASFLHDSAGFLASWLADLAVEQGDDGVVPFTVPNIVGSSTPAAAWGDAAVIVPWTIYQRYGDRGVLAAQFPSMCAWVDRLRSLAGENRLWDTGFQFGDWLDPTVPGERSDLARTYPEIVATAYVARSAELVSRAAEVLGRREDAEKYSALAEEVRAAFRAEYVTPAGRLLSDSQTAYALALTFRLIADERIRCHAGQRLTDLVRGSGHTIATGFVGTPLICDALTDAGSVETAYRLLLQRGYPSWLYPVTQGATTIWERWNSLLPDGRVNPNGMTSFNHYALGAVADWLHRVVGGLAPAEPGYQRLRVAPRPGADLTSAGARLRTPYGLAACSWKLDREILTVDVVVPANTTAELDLPGCAQETIGSGSHRRSVPFTGHSGATSALTLDSTMREVGDRPEAMKAINDVIIAWRPEIADLVATGPSAISPETTVRDALAILRNDALLADVEAAFAALSP
ncbi:glycoside hydrolase family 78 protein [Frankia sp. CNm7]|uniref:alpha-L-rhamnosidase n=1 Tax=Frankia nepalensis TaxID=1836974 RepID=A0A937RKF6_9ACTN|nr:glycoside hydrolase family 78 protein [Frankia nepalensis]MBL7497367.1 glycoside hydrolase family 78 protein [Frankia nepalensis]MBL7510941.1 glycoside hydrolase family 78 protein [Frankia nepalensis]MBL7517257.1 glycoside hydrolase family 78 protein [Frankia nepalensis]MBL7631940.1 glycoside hydrolase family 78 protein [Frankia nepalensis]